MYSWIVRCTRTVHTRALITIFRRFSWKPTLRSKWLFLGAIFLANYLQNRNIGPRKRPLFEEPGSGTFVYVHMYDLGIGTLLTLWRRTIFCSQGRMFGFQKTHKKNRRSEMFVWQLDHHGLTRYVRIIQPFYMYKSIHTLMRWVWNCIPIYKLYTFQSTTFMCAYQSTYFYIYIPIYKLYVCIPIYILMYNLQIICIHTLSWIYPLEWKIYSEKPTTVLIFYVHTYVCSLPWSQLFSKASFDSTYTADESTCKG
jgi:hypothetical protein